MPEIQGRTTEPYHPHKVLPVESELPCCGPQGGGKNGKEETEIEYAAWAKTLLATKQIEKS
jgi:hypothetical protein